MKLWRHLTRRPWLAPLVLFLLSCLYPLGLRLNFNTISQPKGLYWLHRGEPRVGQLVLVELPPEVAAFGAERGYLRYPELAKCVAALTGDRVTLSSTGIRVNGEALPGTAPLARDSKGRPIGAYPPGSYDTLPGWLWLYSNHIPNSWDSRYFGPVPMDSVRGRLVPLLTWPRFPRNAQGEMTCNWQTTTP